MLIDMQRRKRTSPDYYKLIATLDGRRQLRRVRSAMIHMLLRLKTKIPEPYLTFYNSQMFRDHYQKFSA